MDSGLEISVLTLKINRILLKNQTDTRNNIVEQFEPFCDEGALLLNSTNNKVNFTVSEFLLSRFKQLK